MKMKIITLSVFLILSACKTNYDSVAFDLYKIPAKTDYSKTESWAVLPGNYPEDLKLLVKETASKKADVFFVYPTLLTDKKNSAWNADVTIESTKDYVRSTAVKYQASAFAAAGNLYVPFYRQAHYRIFVDGYKDQGLLAWDVAYEDVKTAFQYYLEHHNDGKPIIIAAHSQGSMHARQLIKDFFDDKPLQNQLVAAYLVGTRIFKDEFKTIKPLTNPTDIGGFVSWNTFKMNKLPKSYERWFIGGVVTNPITWNNQNESDIEDHKGLLNKDLKLYPKSLRVKKIDGLLWSSVPKIPGRILLSVVKNYHYADINLFWGDIQENAQERVNHWFEVNQEQSVESVEN